MAQPLSRVERRKQETRRDILDAAFECFAERGYHATSIAHIVKKVGVAQGTFYLYFQSKRDIIDQVLDDLVARMTEALASTPPETPADLDDYRRQAERITDNLTRVFTEDPRATRLLLLQAAAVDDEMAERVLALHELAASWQAGYLRHGVEAGYFRADLDVESAARAVNGMIFAAAMYQLRSPAQADLDRLSRTIREMIYHGLAGEITPRP
ncbi:TetR/AcrR family transcriptional regulator [Nocardia yamanashiensis]|uniref:TetR/AcrR family transcriptional regulator n=1 Tax=Nocardia yamanashiensis TaxID=209247 RepID=UPI001E3C697F|nr:TetR/AcrR family transcriptional regulator [Nocardia yamanashiensis]UGT38748.1 TetR/AcrR family transcriptional regulator [Nocardia yamanashiensis]